ncbi:MAG: hypothetical protein JNM18_06695 [Planctomycetaceae bacterium]|nr:hypothetical protein [Planctomycetaceae bacterium]
MVEARAGAVGTNRHDVLLGIPQTNLSAVSGVTGVPAAIPEIPIAKSTQQKGVAKLAMFAYNQVTGQPIWQSGSFPVAADSRDTWVLGTGPFQRGTIYSGTNFAGSRLLLPFAKDKPEAIKPSPHVPVTAEATFTERPDVVPPSRPQLATRPNPPAGTPAGPPPFQPAYPPSMPVPVKVPAVPQAPPQTQGTVGGSTVVPSVTLPAANGNATGGNATQGLLFLGNGATR